MDLGTDSLDAHKTHHIKGDVIWALGPKAKHELMRNVATKSQCGKELRTSAYKKCLNSSGRQFYQREVSSTAEPNSSKSIKKMTRHEFQLMKIGKNLWISKESANLTESHPKKVKLRSHIKGHEITGQVH